MSSPVPDFIESGAGPNTVLFLHGIGGGAHSYDGNLSALPDGWRGLAWWAPGYGAGNTIGEMSFESLADAVIRLLDAQRVDQAVIVGHSMGGMIAQEVVARYPARVRGLVLFATSAAFGGRDDTFRDKFLADRLKPLDQGLAPADFAGKLVGGMFGPATTAETKSKATASMAAVSPETYRAALTCIVRFDRRADLATISCPTLMLAAENDSLAPPRTMEKMATNVPGAQYACLEGVGHLANMEDPAAFNAAINRFLEQLTTVTEAA